jgi:hypothetical protein
MKGKLAILVNTCDQYSDVWELFIRSLEEFFPECDVPIYFNTETIDSLPFRTALDVNFINSDGPWGKRLKSCLHGINEDFVVNVFDDYLLEDRLDLQKLFDVVDLLSLNDFLSVVYLNAVSLRYHRNIPNAGFREIKNFTEYRLNSAPAVWRKKDLLKLTHDNDSPWSWEVFGTYRSFSSKQCFLSPSSTDNNIFSYDYKKGGAIYRGKWVAAVIDKKIKKYNICLDPNVRGYTDSSLYQSRPIFWKFSFVVNGFRTDGMKALWFLLFYARNKINF